MLAAVVAISLVLSSVDPFEPRRVEGFPETVDLDDESTWSELSGGEKDQLRAIRQREVLRAKAADAKAAAEAAAAVAEQAAAEAAAAEEAARAAMPPPSPTTEHGPSERRLEGFPETVDLDDEATWAGLTVEQKDQLRSIRALEWARAQEAKRPPPKPEPERERAPRRSRYEELSAAQDAWEERDTQLTGMTAAFGAVFGLSLLGIAGAAAGASSSAAECAASFDCGRLSRTVTWYPATIGTLAAVNTITGIGLVVSSISLGVHRNSGRAQVYANAGGVTIRF